MMTRWEKAQTYERNWWQHRAPSINLEYYHGYADDLMNELRGILTIERETAILEIGSGAAGIITFLPSEKKFAIDPLEQFYAAVKKYAEFRDKDVSYFAGRGEALPFEKAKFDFIIMDNVLDHCEDPDSVLREMKRVLKPGGIVYFRQNTYHWWGKFIRQFIELFQIDKGHPHSFRKKELFRFFRMLSFTVLKSKENGYFQTWKKELGAGTLKGLAKALLFATRDRALFILKASQ